MSVASLLAATEAPRREAAWIMAHILGIADREIYRHLDRLLTPDEQQAYANACCRLEAGEPLAYIIGETDFYGISLRVNPAVLVPRPETEGLVDLARSLWPHGNVLLADIGTGSGALACALAYHLRNTRVLAMDRSAAALRVAANNIAQLGLETRVRTLLGDLASPLERLGLQCDGMVANLPYLSSEDMAERAVQLRHEPEMALYGGPDGLELYRRLMPQAARLLAPGGHLAVEVGQGQAEQVAALMRRFLQTEATVHRDLFGVQRFVVGIRG